ncbi:dTDP-4-dehydrorhamnose reductase [Terriglobus roseus DSM 18391]|uniref:dTDP-4-dehydrorhamnose reductase n=1 Tax=Terriglobus roseus (strain DSM 18391 / NRRL B-41598 / KBS 63) TaxID=926566 RepID=I3ZCQ4_TERRK|nr:dTDP-4-dehydrorhamnose reductase [Terriglobus roseus]AFL87022.1 dTDP-4-dehydrorhamnose reductase [Terriglobus roseus DSM 18391]
MGSFLAVVPEHRGGTIQIHGKILITGTSGQVGSALLQRLRKNRKDIPVVAPTRAEMDLASADSIRSYVRSVEPRWIVSCAAYTAVDAAESDREAAFAANAVAPGVLAEEAAALGTGIVHLSTDYVFPGDGTRPWTETDATAPPNVYGASKLAGEEAIAAVAAETGALPWFVLRTSWVYSGGGKNFVRTMLRLLSTKTDPLRVVADQHGAPTAAADLADAILAMMLMGEDLAAQAATGENSKALGREMKAKGAVALPPLMPALADLSGVYHCAGTGDTTWAGLADAVRDALVEEHGMTPPEIIPVPSSAYPTPAARPLNSRMDCSKLAENFGIRLPHWRQSVAEALRELAATDLPDGGK